MVFGFFHSKSNKLPNEFGQASAVKVEGGDKVVRFCGGEWTGNESFVALFTSLGSDSLARGLVGLLFVLIVHRLGAAFFAFAR